MGAFLLVAGDYRVGVLGPYKFTANEVAIGLTMPLAAIEILRQRLAPAQFNRAVMLAETFAPEAAAEAGFVDRVVEPCELPSVARETAVALSALDMRGARGDQAAGEGAHPRSRPRGHRCRLRGAATPGVELPVGAGCRERNNAHRSCATGCCTLRSPCSTNTALPASRLATSPRAPKHRSPPCTSCSATRPGSYARSFSRGLPSCAAVSMRSRESDDPRADLLAVVDAYRAFVHANPVLAAVMFSRPFADFDPGPAEVRKTGSVRRFVVGRVRRCIDAGVLVGDETDISHALLGARPGTGRTRERGLAGELEGVGRPSLVARIPSTARRSQHVSRSAR